MEGNMTIRTRQDRGKQVQLLKRILMLIFVFLLTLLIPAMSYQITNSFYPIKNNDVLYFNMICHGVQLILSIILLKVWFRENISQLGFNLNNKDLGLKILKWFLPIWFIIIGLFYLVSLGLSHGFGNYIISTFPADFKFMIKEFTLQLFLSGTGEEPLFRAFVVLALIKYWDGNFKVGKLNIPQVALISGFFFMIGHINYNIYPFSVTHFDSLQLTYTFILGVFWANIFIKTKSLFSPILAHNGANIIQYAVEFFTSFLLSK